MEETTTTGGASLRAAVLRNLTGGVLVVVLTAAVFWGIGTSGRVDDPASEAAGLDTSDAQEFPSTPQDAGGDADAAPSASGGDEPASETPPPDGGPDEEPPAGESSAEEPTSAEDAADADEAGVPAQEPASDDETVDEPDRQEGSDPDDETQGDDEGGEDEAGDDKEPSIDPASLRLQVLDGYQADGGTAAGTVADELRELGYDVIAENPALRYDVTTVLYTDGNEEAARQVASDIGAAEVRPAPQNLSDAVQLHVVVGADRA